MDVRLSPEQRALRDSAAQVVDRLGPHAVGQLADGERAAKLDAAVAAAGWRELRTATDDGAPWASGVEVAIVAEELARGLADTAFLGPTMAAELRRLAGAPPAAASETVVLAPDLSSPTWRATARSLRASSPSTPAARRRPSCSSRLAGGCTLAQVEVPAGRRAGRSHPPDGPAGADVCPRRRDRPGAGPHRRRSDPLDGPGTCRHLRRPRRQHARSHPARQRLRQGPPAVRPAHRVVPGGAAHAGRRPGGDGGIAQRRSPRRLGRGCAAARRRAGRGCGRQGVLHSSRPLGMRDRHPGARRHRQHMGVPGACPPAARAPVE